MTTEALEYRVYGLPIEAKSYDMNDDGTLTIVGVASTTNKDYANEIVSPEVLESLAQQAVGINIYRDHNRHYDGGIGAVIKAWVTDNQLWIEGKILSEYAPGIKERLDIGMNFGFSISGFPKKQRTPEGLLIVDYDLKDITLTYIPMNWDTYGTVEYKSQNLIASNCLTGACYHALNDGEIMSEEETKTEPIQEEPVIDEKDMNNDAGLSDAQKNEVKDIMNEVIAELEPRIIENLKPELESMADSAANKAAEEVANKIVAELKATTTVQEEDTVEEKELPTEEEEIEEVSEPVETPTEEEDKSEAGASEPTTGDLEEEDKADSEEVEESEPEEEEIEEKSLDEKIHAEIVKQFNEKFNEKSITSKFNRFKKESKTKTDSETKPKRDAYGRNLNYI